MPQSPSQIALVPFVSVENMMRLVHHIGIEAMLVELTDVIEADFRRWEAFDKTPRVASHSHEGVIELMPTSDGEIYSFKYVNGIRRTWREACRRSPRSGFSPNFRPGIRSFWRR